MPPASRTRLVPWIESLILHHGSEQGDSRQLKAHVVGVGHMSTSQVRVWGSEGPTGLLFLSDGVVQIPAVLTGSAWERLQELEERECLSGLVNATVCVRGYHLRFHRAQEDTSSRFFLSVGELTTTATGTVKGSTPCCTTLPSVQLKICQTWRALQDQDQGLPDSKESQSGINLSELLGAWQLDCLQDVLDDVRERLMAVRSCPAAPQPSTSSCNPSLLQPDVWTATGWDADRVKYKGAERFSIPISHLLIPEEEAQQPDERSETPSGLLAASKDRTTGSPLACQHAETDPPPVDDVEQPAAFERRPEASEDPPAEVSMLGEMVARMIDCDIRPLSNPWDIFPPPLEMFNTSSSSGESVTSEVLPLLDPVQSQPGLAVVVTSTQCSVRGSGTSEQSKGEHSFLPPYQKPQPSFNLAPASGSSSSSSTSVRPPELTTAPLRLSPGTDDPCSHAAQRTCPVSNQGKHVVARDADLQKAVAQGKCRKRSEPTPDAVTALEEDSQMAPSPPSWLFESQVVSRAEVAGGFEQDRAPGTVSRKTPAAHSDGSRFSYSYRVSDQSLQDFSRLEVADDLLHWAVRYLIAPRQADIPHTSGC